MRRGERRWRQTLANPQLNTVRYELVLLVVHDMFTFTSLSWVMRVTPDFEQREAGGRDSPGRRATTAEYTYEPMPEHQTLGGQELQKNL